MKKTGLFSLIAGILAGCSNPAPDKTTHAFTPAEMAAIPSVKAPVPPAVVAKLMNLDAYKEALARHISSINASKVYSGRPQALLRSVIVLKFFVDESGIWSAAK